MSMTSVDTRPRQTSQQHHNGKRRRESRQIVPMAPPKEWDSGTVKFYKDDDDRKFGYIRPDSGGNDVYVDGRLLARWGLKSLDQNARVRFKFAPGRKSGHFDAHNIRLI